MKADRANGGQNASKQVQDALASSEARMRALLEAAIDGIISIDEQGTIQTTNSALERLFGYPAAELIGQNVKMLMPAPYREEHDGYIARYQATGEKRIIGIGREVVGRRKDGTTFPMDLSVAEARLDNQRIFLGIVRDITERRHAENVLRDSRDQVQRALLELQAKTEEVRTTTQQLWHSAKLASVGELAASIAHELNNPLGTVSLRIESVLARTPADDPRRRALEVIEQECKRMGHLVANLLQFSRRSDDQISTVNICEELGKAVELVQHHFRKRQITHTQELAADTPTIFADRQKLRQVFLNLLTNASDAMPQGGTLTLRAAPTTLDTGKPGVLIEVADTGVGIPNHQLEKVLEPFFTTKAEGQGTGLGLAICRRVVQEHRGTIQVASTVGEGTTVRIVLPLKDSSNVDPIRAHSSAERQSRKV